ncbi:hypothetical protein DFH28DRAFT_894893 [Melampsora americana]|nr:hypothetical protein DFH28DRAFT_894893 [Melampsora americana]
MLYEICDKLLQTKSLLDTGAFNPITLYCLELLDLKDCTDPVTCCLYHILQHLVTLHPIPKHIVEPWSPRSKPFQLIRQEFQCIPELQTPIDNYITSNRFDDHMTGLLRSLTK